MAVVDIPGVDSLGDLPRFVGRRPSCNGGFQSEARRKGRSLGSQSGAPKAFDGKVRSLKCMPHSGYNDLDGI